jgi:23S rRNA maturation mini-RNase III
MKCPRPQHQPSAAFAKTAAAEFFAKAMADVFAKAMADVFAKAMADVFAKAVTDVFANLWLSVTEKISVIGRLARNSRILTEKISVNSARTGLLRGFWGENY